MNFRWGRVHAIFRKELRDYRRNRFLSVSTMAVMPLVFVILPIVQVFKITATGPSPQLDTRMGFALMYMLIIPTMIPSALAAYSVVGEREQGTLEPVLSTPIRQAEILVAKALSAFVPAVLIAYAVFGIFLGAVGLFAEPVIASAVFEPTHLLVQLLFTPLLAGWAIWMGIAVSTRVNDVRTAQQLGVLASLPPLAVVALFAFGVLTPSTGLALGLAGGLLLIDVLAWRVVATFFNRERLISRR